VATTATFTGPVTAGNLVGPVAISAAAGASNTAALLSVAGPTLLQDATANTVTMTTGVASKLSIQRTGTAPSYGVGPDAGSEALTAQSTRLVVVSNAGGTLVTTGYAVDFSRVLMPYKWAGMGGATVVTDPPVKVAVVGTRYGQASYAVVGGVVYSPTWNLALVSIGTAVFPTAASLNIANYARPGPTDSPADTPAAGLAVTIMYADSVLGTIQQAPAYLANNSLQFFQEFTSHQLTLGNTGGLPPGGYGGIVVDFAAAGAVLSIVQTGSPAQDAGASGTYVTAIKGRYINYFLAAAESAGPGLLAVPVVTVVNQYTSTAAAGRGIAQSLRQPGTLPGGVTLAAAGDNGIPQTHILHFGPVGGVATPLSSSLLVTNNPSVSDTAIATLASAPTASFLAQSAVISAPPFTLTYASSATVPGVWSAGAPQTVHVSRTAPGPATTQFLQTYAPLLAVSSPPPGLNIGLAEGTAGTLLAQGFTGLSRAGATDVIALHVGYGRLPEDSAGLPSLVTLVAGNAAAVSGYIIGLAGNSDVAAAWGESAFPAQFTQGKVGVALFAPNQQDVMGVAAYAATAIPDGAFTTVQDSSNNRTVAYVAGYPGSSQSILAQLSDVGGNWAAPNTAVYVTTTSASSPFQVDAVNSSITYVPGTVVSTAQTPTTAVPTPFYW